MKLFLLTFLAWTITSAQIYSQNQLPLSIQPYAVNWGFSVKQMFQAAGYEVPGPVNDYAIKPEIKYRSIELQLDSTVTYSGYSTSADSFPLLRNVYTYPQPGTEVITEYYYEFDHWVPLSRTTVIEDEQGRLTDAIAQVYDDATGIFMPDSRIEMFPRDNSDEADSFFIYAWSPEKLDYQRHLAVINTFDENNRLVESFSSFEIFEFPIQFIDKYFYSTEGDLSLILSFTNDGVEEIPAGRQDFWYDDHLLTRTEILVSDGPGGFIAQTKTEYTYTDFRKEELVQSFEYDFEKQDWRLTQVDGYTYDNQERVNGHEIGKANEQGNWDRQFNTFDYVRNEYPSSETVHFYDNHQEKWIVQDKNYYFYKELVSTDPDPVETEALLLYPNPSSGIVQLELEGQASIEVYSFSGQRVQSFQMQPGEKILNLSALPAGIYQVIGKNEEAYYTGKLIIQ